jgi:hypothetical protein
MIIKALGMTITNNELNLFPLFWPELTAVRLEG